MQTNHSSPTIVQAIQQLQILPPASQQTALDFINFLATQHSLKAEQSNKKIKRQFGQMVGKGSFTIKDDFEMTEEEFINL